MHEFSQLPTLSVIATFHFYGLALRNTRNFSETTSPLKVMVLFLSVMILDLEMFIVSREVVHHIATHCTYCDKFTHTGNCFFTLMDAAISRNGRVILHRSSLIILRQRRSSNESLNAIIRMDGSSTQKAQIHRIKKERYDLPRRWDWRRRGCIWGMLERFLRLVSPSFQSFTFFLNAKIKVLTENVKVDMLRRETATPLLSLIYLRKIGIRARYKVSK